MASRNFFCMDPWYTLEDRLSLPSHLTVAFVQLLHLRLLLWTRQCFSFFSGSWRHRPFEILHFHINDLLIFFGKERTMNASAGKRENPLSTLN